MSVAPDDPPALVATPLASDSAEVVGRHVFYNNSRFDLHNPAANASDDGAVAPDKQPLFSGQAATFANYTSYASGINGVMVDVAGLAGTPTAEDFRFRIGNTNSPGDWIDAPAPLSVSVRAGAGTGGSARITVVWADGTVRNMWLEVTVLPTERTGLTSADVFYFGNAVGETGTFSSNAITNSIDEFMVKINGRTMSNPAPISSPYDFNRDALVDLADLIIARTAYNGQGSVLKLIAPDGSGQEVIPSTGAEDTQGGAPAALDPPAYVDFVSADVVGRHVFYNNSQFDGINPVANAADDAAIATDKAALLPGQTAVEANYTNYSRGINGIMVDVAGLSGAPTLDDFEFRVGNSADPSAWNLAPRPMSITTRPGAGVGGADRVTIVWPDKLISNAWLQVTVKASPRTGLSRADVFYFGNLVGDVGGTTARPIVNAADQFATRNSPYTLANPAPITSAADYNRDRLVNAADEWIARAHRVLPLVSQFDWFTAPPSDAPAEAVRPAVDFYHWGDGDLMAGFGPNLVTTPDGTLLFIAESRWGIQDAQSNGVMMRRSFDGGVTWTPVQTIYEVPPHTFDVGSPVPVVDDETGEVFVFYITHQERVWLMSSTDDGASWSVPQEITTDVKVTPQGNPNPAAFPDDPWQWYALTHGIQLKNGPHAGRLVVGGDHRLTDDVSGTSWSHVIYSDDHGQTWHLGGGLRQDNPVNNNSNEISLVEASDGSLYMSIRMNSSSVRGSARSFDGGMTWTAAQTVPALTTGAVHGSLLRVNESTVLFAAPDVLDKTRQKMTIWVSHDDMFTWTKTKTVFYGIASYSGMTLVGPDTVLLAFNGSREYYDFVRHTYLVRFNLRWLESPDDYQFTWNFDEKHPGELTDLNGPSILDDSLWDNRATPLANAPAEAPRYVEGPDGHTALRFTAGSDRVMLTPIGVRALQFTADESFTVQMTVRTTATSGVFIGPDAFAIGWSLELASGFLQFSVNDGVSTSSVQSAQPINDGNWHRITATRDAAGRWLSVLVDDADFTFVADQTTKSLWSPRAIMLGSNASGGGQLAFDIDGLRITRSVVPQGDFPSFDEPPRYAAPAYPDDAPHTIPDLQLWLPAYDHSRFFADMNFSEVLSIEPALGSATHSAIDVSPNAYRLTSFADNRHILYAEDPLVGPTWLYQPDSYWSGRPWIVKDSNGAGPASFDFVQNTGVFTLSTVFKASEIFEGYSVLFDTTGGSLGNPGFSLAIMKSGAVNFTISTPSTTRFVGATPAGSVALDAWYHLAVVGNGPGQPVLIYLTPVTGSTLATYSFTAGILGPDGNYPTDAAHNLTIGAVSGDGRAPFIGQMVDQAIYSRALSASEIMQLFQYTKKTD